MPLSNKQTIWGHMQTQKDFWKYHKWVVEPNHHYPNCVKHEKGKLVDTRSIKDGIKLNLRLEVVTQS